MATEIWTELDPNLDLPPDLKNVTFTKPTNDEVISGEVGAEIDVQIETLDDDSSIINEDEPADNLDIPGSFSIVSQTIKTGADGRQVVDVVIDVEEVPGATNYNVRVTK
jgi:hypothetical protein